MINYETFCRIGHLHTTQHLTDRQIAESLALDVRTVRYWLTVTQFRPRQAPARTSKLDPFKDTVRRLLEAHRLSAVQVHQRLNEAGYKGGISIVRDYVRLVRPNRAPAFLTLSFAPGECAQVDWGEFGSIAVGNTRRRLSFFVMVLCHSRALYVEFTVSQTLEHFLAGHHNAFQFFGGVPEKIMVDNLKSAVLKRLTGEAPVFNPRYLDFAGHHGFTIAPCNVGKGNEKGRVESGVGYVKKNFLSGLELADFSAINPAARIWLDEIANVRIHGETRKRPVDLLAEERARLRPLPAIPHDLAAVHALRASNRFRVTFETNRYSVPAEYASVRLTLKAWPDRVCIYHRDQLVARHARSYDRHGDFEHPDHPRALLAQRRSARAQRLLQRFLTLSPRAQAYYDELTARRFNARHHIQKIVALAEIHGTESVARAIEDAFVFQAFSCEYIANLLDSRLRTMPEPAALHLTRKSDWLDIELEEPDLSLYDRNDPEAAS